MAYEEPALTVRLSRENRDTDRVKSYRLQSAFLTSTDGFDVTLYEPEPNRALLRGLELEPVELLVSGSRVGASPQMIGRIDATEIGNDGTAVTIRGRDYFADMVECRIDPSFKVSKQTDLGQAILGAVAPVGITTIISDANGLQSRNARTGKQPNGTKPPKDFKVVKMEDLKPKPGQGIYEFCNRLCARNGATIQPTNTREALDIVEPDYEQGALYALSRTSQRINGRNNNIISARAVRDFSSFPTYTLFKGKKQGGAGKSKRLEIELATFDAVTGLANVELETILSDSITVTRRKPQDSVEIPDGALYRLLYQEETDAKNTEQLLRVATRAMAERLKDTLVYTVTVQGHEDPESGALWGVNTVVDVQDEITDVNEPLWIASRTFSYDASGGAKTELECWRLNSFQV